MKTSGDGPCQKQRTRARLPEHRANGTHPILAELRAERTGLSKVILALELEEVTLKLPVVKGQVLARPAVDDLTVVIPTRNERDNIMPLLHELQEALDGIRVEIIFVDDSDDATPLLIKDASRALETSLFQVHLEHRQPGPARAGGLALPRS